MYSPKYQLRLYCTSATYYSPSTYRANSELCPIEFPPTCEIRVNGMALNANTKGLKKKPGTAPPADLSKVVKPSAANRLEMIYVNSTANPTNTPAKVWCAPSQFIAACLHSLAEILRSCYVDGSYTNRYPG
jgi:hypothetical protein